MGIGFWSLWSNFVFYDLFVPFILKGSYYTIIAENSTRFCKQCLWTCWSFLHPVQFSSVAQSCPTHCDPMNCSMPGLPVHQQLPEFTQTHVHRFGDAIQPSHPLLSPSPPASSPSQHPGLFQCVNSLHEVSKVLEFQLQHQSFQWTPKTDVL